MRPFRKAHLGQQVAYLGFPFDFDTYDVQFSNQSYNRPQPAIKSGIISKFYFGPNAALKEKKYVNQFYIESLNNAGFSGGPVMINIARPGREAKLRVVAIVSGYRFDKPIPLQILQEDGGFTDSNEYYIRPNSGFMIATPISKLLNMD